MSTYVEVAANGRVYKRRDMEALRNEVAEALTARPMARREIAEALHTHHQKIQQVLDELQRDGAVEWFWKTNPNRHRMDLYWCRKGYIPKAVNRFNAVGGLAAFQAAARKQMNEEKGHDAEGTEAGQHAADGADDRSADGTHEDHPGRAACAASEERT